MTQSAAKMSIPPEARVIAAQGNATALVMAHLTEISIVWGAVLLRALDRLEETNLIWALGALIGPGLSKALGRPVIPTVAALLAVLPGTAKAMGLSILVVLLGSCSPAATQLAAATLPALLEVAGPHLEALAAEKGVELDRNRGICIEVPVDSMEDLLPEDYSVPVVAVLCAAPDLP
ncbi:MAG: hypothetical protein V3S01_07925 [Dehalococcoidia bacterium]